MMSPPFPDPARPPRRGPAAWVVVLITLGAVALVGVVFVTGVAVGFVAGRVGGGTASQLAQPLPPAPVLPGDEAPAPADVTPGAPAPDDVTPGAPAPAPSGGAGAGGGFDECLVGTWQSTEHSESYETEQGPASIAELERTIEFGPDGRQTITYDSSRATITTQVGALPAVFDGSVVYVASTSGSTMSFELVSADGTVTIIGPDGEVAEERPIEPGTGDVSYACDETDFVQEAPGYRSAYERVG
ncbi:hypothetical protein [Jannaschia sp. R86511]|uniref:hypothetical protein n=1 Tax=Jannaschia sp. R86511 TaxID=3093853 RepID=UPI0036D32914